jgi:hypothetical protein
MVWPAHDSRAARLQDPSATSRSQRLTGRRPRPRAGAETGSSCGPAAPPGACLSLGHHGASLALRVRPRRPRPSRSTGPIRRRSRSAAPAVVECLFRAPGRARSAQRRPVSRNGGLRGPRHVRRLLAGRSGRRHACASRSPAAGGPVATSIQRAFETGHELPPSTQDELAQRVIDLFRRLIDTGQADPAGAARRGADIT